MLGGFGFVTCTVATAVNVFLSSETVIPDKSIPFNMTAGVFENCFSSFAVSVNCAVYSPVCAVVQFTSLPSFCHVTAPMV